MSVAAQSPGRATGATGSPAAGPVGWLVRTGFLARGLTYALIAAIAIRLAVDGHQPSATPNQQGALTLVTRAPLGRAVLVAIAVGLLAYALWKLALAYIGNGFEGRSSRTVKDRVANLAGGVAYLAFFGLAVRVLIGSSGSQAASAATRGGGRARDGRAEGGSWGSAGVVMIAISAYQIYSALRGDFAEENKVGEMTERPWRLFLILGRAGLTARALVFVLVGYFLVRTATDFNSPRRLGVDGALGAVQKLPFGTWLLGFVALGLLLFAAFSLFEARYQRL